jgi:hypothetical protein
MSKTHGAFFKKNPNLDFKKSLFNHNHTEKLKDSGFTVNHNTFDRTGWTPHSSLDSDMKRTEYRIQYNNKKDIHYKGPLFSTGMLKKKEANYKHT